MVVYGCLPPPTHPAPTYAPSLRSSPLPPPPHRHSHAATPTPTGVYSFTEQGGKCLFHYNHTGQYHSKVQSWGAGIVHHDGTATMVGMRVSTSTLEPGYYTIVLDGDVMHMQWMAAHPVETCPAALGACVARAYVNDKDLVREDPLQGFNQKFWPN